MTSRRYRPTAFGVVLAGVVVASIVWRSKANDPQVAALLLAVTISLLLVGTVWAIIIDRLIDVDVDVTSSSDYAVDEMTDVGVEVRSKGIRAVVGVRILDPFSGLWTNVETLGRRKIVSRPTRRGEFDTLTVETRSTFPFGVFRVDRQRTIVLDRPLLVGPRIFREAPLPDGAVDGHGDNAVRSAADHGDIVRTVRPYRVGDSPRRVDWKSSARVGELIVREFEPVAQPTSVIVVDLGTERIADDERIENAVSWAAGLAAAGLSRGDRVMLCTASRRGSETAVVNDERAISRQLARAGCGIPRPPATANPSSQSVTWVRP